MAPTPLVSGSRWRTTLSLLLLFLFAFALRYTVVERWLPTQLMGDEQYYAVVAVNIAAGRGHVYRTERAWRPPAHPWLLSHVADLTRPRLQERIEDSLRAMVLLQVVLGSLLCVATALLGAALFDRRTGLVAGGAAAVYPTFVAHSHYLWSEMTFALLVTAALAAVVRAERRPTALAAVFVGLLLGAAALVRELALPVAGIAAVYWVWLAEPRARRRAAVYGVLLVAVAGAVVLPWTARNYRQFGRLVPVSTVGWFALGEGNTFENPDWMRTNGPAKREYYWAYFNIRDEMKRLDFAREHALARIEREQPAWLARKIARNVPLLLAPDSYLFEKLRRGYYKDLGLTGARALIVLCILAYLSVALAGIGGIATAPGRGRVVLPCALFAAVLAIHLIANSASRFRVPWMPLVLVYASWLVLHARAAVAAATPARIAAAVAAAILLFACIPPFAGSARALWHAGGEAGAWDARP